MQKTLTSILSLTIVASALAFSSCDKKTDENAGADSSAAAQQVKSGTGKGVVVSIDSSRNNVELSHNDIPGIMEAMSMNYRVEKPALLDHVGIGDSVAFTLAEPQPGEFVVTAISSMPKK